MEVGLERVQKIKTDPFYHDPQAAAFWLYGLSALCRQLMVRWKIL